MRIGAPAGGAPPGAPVGPPGTTRRGTAVHLALVAAVGLAAYSNSFRVPFQFDDGNSIVENRAVRDVGTFLSTPLENRARAVAYFTFAVNGSLNGQAVWGYHAVNLAVHLAAAACVYLLVRFLARAALPDAPASARGASAAALLAALLFVAHPVQTQAVTYIVQRIASLCGLLYVGATLVYLHAARAAGPRRIGLTAAALGLAALALFTKQNAVTLVASLALVDALFLRGSLRERALRLVPFLVLTGVAVGPVDPGAMMTAGEEAIGPATRPAAGPAWATYLLSQPRVILTYLRLIVLPVHQNLDYDQPVYSSPLAPPVIASVAALALLLGVPALLAWRARRTSGLARIVLFGVGWFAVTLSVESSFIPLADVIFEHRLYLPSVGPFAVAGCAAACGLGRLGGRARTAAAVALAAVVLALAAATYARNEVWRDRLTLWTDVLEKSPGKSRPYNFVAQDLMERGEYARALPLLERGASLEPVYPHLFLNLGVAYARLGRPADAERAYRRGIGAGGGAVAGAHLALGLLLLDAGRVGEACEHFAAEVRVASANRQARTNAMACRFQQGDLTGAVAEGERLAAEDPRDAPVLYNLALGYSRLGDVPRARHAYQRFLSVAGDELRAERAAAARWLAEHP